MDCAGRKAGAECWATGIDRRGEVSKGYSRPGGSG
jgi:hypothetical protein